MPDRVKEKLVELLRSVPAESGIFYVDWWALLEGAEDIADVLIAGGVTVREWISVKEQLPDTMKPVIVCRKGGKVEQGFRDLNGWWKVYGTRTKNITHWMPLPQPPGGE